MTGAHTEEFLTNIIECALDAIENGRREHIYRWDHASGRKVAYHLARDLERLDACCRHYDITTEKATGKPFSNALKPLLKTRWPATNPPTEPVCSHEEAFGSEMHAFVVELADFTRPIYTKFCLNEQTDGTWYVSIDCHT